MPASPLSSANVQVVIRELEQTAWAVSAVGTTRRKLKEMAALVEPIAKALVGMRPDVRRVRLELHQLIQAVQLASVKARPAADQLRRLAAALRKVLGLLGQRIGNVDAEFDVSGFPVVNVWGFSSREMAPVTNALSSAASKLKLFGLSDLQTTVVLDPQATGYFVEYNPRTDILVMDPKRSGFGRWNVFYALARRIWLRRFRQNDKEVWSIGMGAETFYTSFADMLDGRKVGRDAQARLRVTVLGKAA